MSTAFFPGYCAPFRPKLDKGGGRGGKTQTRAHYNALRGWQQSQTQLNARFNNQTHVTGTATLLCGFPTLQIDLENQWGRGSSFLSESAWIPRLPSLHRLPFCTSSQTVLDVKKQGWQVAEWMTCTHISTPEFFPTANFDLRLLFSHLLTCLSPSFFWQTLWQLSSSSFGLLHSPTSLCPLPLHLCHLLDRLVFNVGLPVYLLSSVRAADLKSREDEKQSEGQLPIWTDVGPPTAVLQKDTFCRLLLLLRFQRSPLPAYLIVSERPLKQRLQPKDWCDSLLCADCIHVVRRESVITSGLARFETHAAQINRFQNM